VSRQGLSGDGKRRDHGDETLAEIGRSLQCQRGDDFEARSMIDTNQRAREMKLFSHIVKDDLGVAPNPFHGYCTTAVCTPSHMNLRLEEGDWLIGTSPKKDSHKLVYAMCILKPLTMNEYFCDERFQCKKPKRDGTDIEQRGDNIYYKHGEEWKQLHSEFHGKGNKEQDVGKNDQGHPVFVAKHFYYFGYKREKIPSEFKDVIWEGQGGRYTRGELAGKFVSWLKAKPKCGIIGFPGDIVDQRGKTKATCTGHHIAESTPQHENEKPDYPRSGGCR
jgi:Nucleotide modification associated domain 2